jgi:hypothetical protein
MARSRSPARVNCTIQQHQRRAKQRRMKEPDDTRRETQARPPILTSAPDHKISRYNPDDDHAPNRPSDPSPLDRKNGHHRTNIPALQSKPPIPRLHRRPHVHRPQDATTPLPLLRRHPIRSPPYRPVPLQETKSPAAMLSLWHAREPGPLLGRV